MAVEATILPLVRILKEMSREEFEDPRLGPQLKNSSKVVEDVGKSLKENEINNVSPEFLKAVFRPEFLKAVFQAEDTALTFRIQNRKRVCVHKAFRKILPGDIPLRSFRNKMEKLVSDVKAKSEKMLVAVESKGSSTVANAKHSGKNLTRASSAENADSAKEAKKEVNKSEDSTTTSNGNDDSTLPPQVPDAEILKEETIVVGVEKKRGAPGYDQSTTSDQLSFGDISSIWADKSLSPHQKACLHYFGLFPKSYEISVRRLLQLWLAEGLVTPIEGKYMAPENQAEEDFHRLVHMNMIEIVKLKSDGKPKTCRVPSSLSGYLSPQAESGGNFCFHQGSGSNATYSSSDLCVRRLAVHLDSLSSITPPDKELLEYLHSYLFFVKREGGIPAGEVGNLPKMIIAIRGYRFLRVLDLEDVYKPVLPETIGKLQLLRYVGLRRTFIDSIPKSLGDLRSLETLDMKHTNITSLPMFIWKVKTLRHLYLNDIHLQMSDQKPFVKPSLTNLQTLWGLSVSKKSSPLNWLENLTGLKNLGLICNIAPRGPIENLIERLGSLRSLRLRSINDFYEPSELAIGSLKNHKALKELYLLGRLPGPLKREELPPNLRIFTLSSSYLSEDPMPVLGQLSELTVLRLFAHSYIGEKMTCGNSGFPQLRLLKLWVLKELKEWTIEEGAMTKLEKLEIRNCPKLKMPTELNKLSELKELTLVDMKKKL